MRSSRFLYFLVAIGIAVVSPVHSMLKQQYGGSLRVAEELVQAINTQQFFVVRDDQVQPLYPLAFEIKENTLTLDASLLTDVRKEEIRRSVAALQEYSDPCHWILDYPYLNHNHQTSIRFEQGTLRVETASPEILSALSGTSCLVPATISEFQPFRKTQFGFEANPECIAGRPFLDSIVIASVDPLNPYLSLKLGDVDVVPIPEDRFHEMKNDPELKIFSGPGSFLYLRTSNLTQQEVALIVQNLDVKELAETVLNNHAEVQVTRNSGTSLMKLSSPVSFVMPVESPYRLLIERMIVQVQNAGLQVQSSPLLQNRSIELQVLPLTVSDFDVSRYLLLRKDWQVSQERNWFEQWDELEATGKIVPLMIHRTALAARKQIQDLQARSTGMPEFSNCWLLELNP